MAKRRGEPARLAPVQQHERERGLFLRLHHKIPGLVERTASEFGRLDIIVNNAGVGTGLHTILEEPEDKYDFVMAVNTKGVWLCCKYAIAQMLIPTALTRPTTTEAEQWHREALQVRLGHAWELPNT